LRKTRAGKINYNRDTIVFKKLCCQHVFRQHKNEKPAFSISSGLKSVFEKLRFRDGLVWTVDLTVEVKLRFQISKAQCGRRLSVSSVPAVATQSFLRNQYLCLSPPCLVVRSVCFGSRVKLCQVAMLESCCIMVTVNLLKHSEKGVVKT